MQTESPSTAQFVEIACDESGSEGENLIGGNTDVFAHASVRLDTESATNCVQEIRNQIRSPALEYKANHLLREKHRSVLRWLLGPLGPIHGHAHVQLADKTFFVVGKLVDLLVGEVDQAVGTGPARGRPTKGMAVALYLYGEGQSGAFGREHWQAFLESANDLMRTRGRLGVGACVDPFSRVLDVLRLASTGGRVGEIIELLRRARSNADAFRAQLLDDPTAIPVLDLLVPAIVQAVIYWGEGSKPVAIVHDEHAALTEDRIAQLKGIVGKPHLASLRLVDSRSDSRVQVADFLAGIARKIASDELHRRGDPELTALLRPYVGSCSIWGDDRSWSVLGPAPSTQS